MTLRTFVSFAADEAAFPKRGEPPGQELARFVSDALRAAGVDHEGPDEREGWAWELFAAPEDVTVECIVGLVDDGPREWLVTNHGHLPFTRRWSRQARARRDQILARWCHSIDDALKGDGRFRTIRWYEAARFDRDHGDTWDEAP